MKKEFHVKPDWKWATPAGSRQFDRMLDSGLTFRERLQWLEAAETLSLRMAGNRRKKTNHTLRVAA